MGCFTYKDSPFFCSDISKEQAESECELYGCNFNQVFFSSRSCTEKEMLQKCNLNVPVVEHFEIIEETTPKIEIPEEETESSFGTAIGIFLFFVAILVFYLFYRKNPEVVKKLFSRRRIPQKQPLNVIKTTPKWFAPTDNKKLNAKKEKWLKKHQHKINEFHRDELLGDFGPKEKSSVTKEFRKLKGLVRTYKRKHKQVEKTGKKEHFAKLDQLSKKIKEKEKIIIENHQNVDPKIIKKHELDKLMKELKNISHGKY